MESPQKRQVFLRMFEEDDYILINQWRNDPEQIELMHSQFRYVSSAIEREWVRSKMMENTREIYLAICLNDDSRRMIGYTSITNVDYVNRNALIGSIWIGDKEQRTGLHCAEALYLACRYAFMSFNLERVHSRTLIEQNSTTMLAMALGTRVEGVMRHSVIKEGIFYDENIIGLLREDFLALERNNLYCGQAIMDRLKKGILMQKKGMNYDEIWHAMYDEIFA